MICVCCSPPKEFNSRQARHYHIKMMNSPAKKAKVSKASVQEVIERVKPVLVNAFNNGFYLPQTFNDNYHLVENQFSKEICPSVPEVCQTEIAKLDAELAALQETIRGWQPKTPVEAEFCRRLKQRDGDINVGFVYEKDNAALLEDIEQYKRGLQYSENELRRRAIVAEINALKFLKKKFEPVVFVASQDSGIYDF